MPCPSIHTMSIHVRPSIPIPMSIPSSSSRPSIYAPSHCTRLYNGPQLHAWRLGVVWWVWVWLAVLKSSVRLGALFFPPLLCYRGWMWMWMLWVGAVGVVGLGACAFGMQWHGGWGDVDVWMRGGVVWCGMVWYGTCGMV